MRIIRLALLVSDVHTAVNSGKYAKLDPDVCATADSSSSVAFQAEKTGAASKHAEKRGMFEVCMKLTLISK